MHEALQNYSFYACAPAAGPAEILEDPTGATVDFEVVVAVEAADFAAGPAAAAAAVGSRFEDAWAT